MADKNLLASFRPLTDDFKIEEPDTTPDDSDEKRRKSISRTKKWKEFLAFVDQRIELYKDFQPGVNPAITKTDDNWRVADCVIKELTVWKNFIDD